MKELSQAINSPSTEQKTLIFVQNYVVALTPPFFVINAGGHKHVSSVDLAIAILLLLYCIASYIPHRI